VDTVQDICTGHKHLKRGLAVEGWGCRIEILALSKAVLHALGCVATKIGFVDMLGKIPTWFSQRFRVRSWKAIYIPSKAFKDRAELLSVFQNNKLGNPEGITVKAAWRWGIEVGGWRDGTPYKSSRNYTNM
jgi:hypothetical protein